MYWIIIIPKEDFSCGLIRQFLVENGYHYPPVENLEGSSGPLRFRRYVLYDDINVTAYKDTFGQDSTSLMLT